MGKLDGTPSFMPALLLTLLVSVSAPVSSLGWVLELIPETELEGPAIHLRDVCREGIPSGVGEIVLRDAVRPGESYNLGRRAILRRLAAMRLADGVSCRGPETCRVMIRAHRLSAESLDKILFERLEAWRPPDSPGAPSGWLELVGDLPGVFVDGAWSVDLVEPRTLSAGRNLVKVRVDSGGRVTRFTATVVCHRYGETARSLAPIAAFAPLTPELFQWEWEDLAGQPSGHVTDRAAIGDRVAATDIPADVLLRDWHLRITPLVRQGEPVELILGRGGVEISLRGISREDGARGQIIAVRNSLDGRLVSGRVIGPNRVAWRK